MPGKTFYASKWLTIEIAQNNRFSFLYGVKNSVYPKNYLPQTTC